MAPWLAAIADTLEVLHKDDESLAVVFNTWIKRISRLNL